MTTRCLKCPSADRSGRSEGAAAAGGPPRPSTAAATSAALVKPATRRPRRNLREQCRTFMAPPHSVLRTSHGRSTWEAAPELTSRRRTLGFYGAGVAAGDAFTGGEASVDGAG